MARAPATGHDQFDLSPQRKAVPRMKSFPSFDGVPIAYREWGPADAEVPVVLLHGFVADGATNWVAPGVVDALVRAGHRVIVPDARGHGASGKPHDPAAYGEARMARDLAALVDEVGAGRIDLVGYSMGAVVSLLAAASGQPLRRLVVAGVGAAIVELGGLDTRALPPQEVAAALLADNPAQVAAGPGAALRMLADAVGADRRALAAQVGRAHQGEIGLERIDAPTLVLCGREDVLAHRPEVLAKAIRDAELQVIPGDHLGAVRDPAFTAAIVRFLA